MLAAMRDNGDNVTDGRMGRTTPRVNALATVSAVAVIAAAAFPSPEHLSSFHADRINLSWASSLAATSYRIYFSTDEAEVRTGVPGSAADGGSTTASFWPTPALVSGQTYFWRIDSTDGTDWATDPVWTFNNVLQVKGPVDEPLLMGDIGSVGIPGSSSFDSDGTLSVQASGADIWRASDQFRYVYRRVLVDPTRGAAACMMVCPPLMPGCV